MEVSSFLYFTACLCACVCLHVLVYLCVCVPLCVHSIWPLNCSLNRIRRLCFLPTTSTNTRSVSLMHSLSLSLTGCFPRVLVKQLLLLLASYCQCTPAHLPAVRDNAAGATFWRRLPPLLLLLLPPHRSYLLRPMFALHFRCCCCCCSCGTHFSQFSVHSATILHSHSARSTRSISTSYSLASPSSSLSSLLACVSLCLFWYSLSACSTVRLSP